MSHQPNTNNTAMGPDAPLPTDKIRFEDDDYNEKVAGDEHSIKRNASAVNPLDALGMDDWRAVEKKVVKRLDMTLLPMLWILYLSNYLDRTNIACVLLLLWPTLVIQLTIHNRQARLNGFDENLGLDDQGYNTAVALLTVGYVSQRSYLHLRLTSD